MRARTLNGPNDNPTFMANRKRRMNGDNGGWLNVVGNVVLKYGSLIGQVVKGWSIGHSAGYKRWEDAGAGVHDWFTNYGRQAFLDWMDANHPDGFGSIDEVLSYLPAWAFTVTVGDAWIVYPGGWGYYQPDLASHWYKEGITEAAYKALGIDYAATFAKMQAINRNNVTQAPESVVYLPGGAIAETASVIAQDAVDAMNSGNASGDDVTMVSELIADGVAWMDAAGVLHFDPNGPPPNTETTDPVTGETTITPRTDTGTKASGGMLLLLAVGGGLLFSQAKN